MNRFFIVGRPAALLWWQVDFLILYCEYRLRDVKICLVIWHSLRKFIILHQ